MRWYVAELIVQCRVGTKSRRKVLFERQIKVLRAATHETAYRKALQLGKSESHSYNNIKGEKVKWQFVGLAGLDELMARTISDGTEISSCFHRGDPKSAVRCKQDLSVFEHERTKHMTVEEFLDYRAKRSRRSR